MRTPARCPEPSSAYPPATSQEENRAKIIDVGQRRTGDDRVAERAEERLLTVLRQEVNYEIQKALAKAR